MIGHRAVPSGTSMNVIKTIQVQIRWQHHDGKDMRWCHVNEAVLDLKLICEFSSIREQSTDFKLQIDQTFPLLRSEVENSRRMKFWNLSVMLPGTYC